MIKHIVHVQSACNLIQEYSPMGIISAIYELHQSACRLSLVSPQLGS